MAKKVITRAVFDLKTGRWIEEQSHPYEGEWAHAGMPGTLYPDAYRFYEDGSESASTAIDSEGTDISYDVDTTIQYRTASYLLEAADTVEGGYFEYDLNSSGTWTAVTTTSDVCRAVTGTASGSTSTNRLSDNGRNHITGTNWVTSDGTLPNLAMAIDDNVEALLNFQIVGSTVSNNDVIDIRLNASTPSFDYTTPNWGSVTAIKAVTTQVYIIS